MNSRALAILLCLLVYFTAHGESRVWRFTSGATVDAAYVKSTTSGTVVLKAQDGKDVTTPRDKLCLQDRNYVKNVLENPKSSPWPVGETIPEVKTADGKWSYLLYLPKRFNMNRKWPVIFLMSPGGGNPGDVKRYMPGAEENGFILAMSKESQNAFAQSTDAIKGMVDDVLARLPVDPTRVCSGGFSGGSFLSFYVAEYLRNKQFLGVLACGAGRTGNANPDSISSDTIIYGLCGARCFNRWNMAVSIEQAKSRSKVLKFFPGGHNWASPRMLADGMTYINSLYLLKRGEANDDLREDKERLIGILLDKVVQNTTTNPEYASDMAQYLQQFKLQEPAAGQLARCMSALNSNKKVEQYGEAKKALQALVRSSFSRGVPASFHNRSDPAASKAAMKLYMEYKDTCLGEVFKGLSEPSA